MNRFSILFIAGFFVCTQTTAQQETAFIFEAEIALIKQLASQAHTPADIRSDVETLLKERPKARPAGKLAELVVMQLRLIPQMLEIFSQKFQLNQAELIAQFNIPRLNQWLIKILQKNAPDQYAQTLRTQTKDLLARIITGSCFPAGQAKAESVAWRNAAWKTPETWKFPAISVTPEYKEFMFAIFKTKAISPDELGSSFGGEGNSTALLLTVFLNNMEVTKLLLEAGANPNRISDGGVLPLYSALTCECISFIKMLIAAGADVNLPTKLCDAYFYHKKDIKAPQLSQPEIAKTRHFHNMCEDWVPFAFKYVPDTRPRSLELLEILLKAGADTSYRWKKNNPLRAGNFGQSYTLLEYADYMMTQFTWPENKKLLQKKISVILRYTPGITAKFRRIFE